jgi:hypothetical protein
LAGFLSAAGFFSAGAALMGEGAAAGFCAITFVADTFLVATFLAVAFLAGADLVAVLVLDGVDVMLIPHEWYK